MWSYIILDNTSGQQRMFLDENEPLVARRLQKHVMAEIGDKSGVARFNIIQPSPLSMGYTTLIHQNE